jgi:NADPH:quinone reductase-like Zn-dependent oxidoreductase/acyl carrier protein
VALLDEGGRVLVEVLGLEVRRLEPAPRERREDDLFLAQVFRLTEPAPPPPPARGRWVLLADGGDLAGAVQSLLEAGGDRVVRFGSADTARADLDALLPQPSDAEAPWRGIVCLGGLDAGPSSEEGAPAVLDAEVEACAGVVRLVQAVARAGLRDAPRLWLITRGCQSTWVGAPPSTPAAGAAPPVLLGRASLWGLGRTLAYEHAELRCTRVDLDPEGAAGEAEALVAELRRDDREEEIALRQEGRYVGRIARRAPGRAGGGATAEAAGRPFRLEIDEPGVLDRLTLRATRRRPPGPGEVEIEVEVAGLNFLDVLLALGVIPPDGGGRGRGEGGGLALGGELAGRVAAVGEGVQDLRPGQAVLGLAPGAFGAFVTTPAALVLPRPPRLSAEEAATLPIAQLTAYHALANVARLARGERILIHAAAGGVGLAALQWARHVGAEIFATAGSPEKQAYLRSLGVDRVTDSRSARFVDDVLAWTNGEGVDVVLNSLSGELIAKGLDLLRDHGRFIELGKRDYFANAKLGLRPFLRNLTLSLVDLLGMTRGRPAHVRALFLEVLSHVESGALAPLPYRAFPISRAVDAFQEMAQGRHTGKIVLRLEDPAARVALPAAEAIAIRSDGTYLITGGLGGLGLSVARWMVAEGARHLLLVGRRGASTPAQAEALAAMRSAGAEVIVTRADVAERADLAGVLARIEGKLPPIRGVVHAAGVLADGLIEQQGPDRLREVMAPKVAGAWNLHALTRGMPLDFFVLYSSAASLLGSPGQANYAAANAFLDALALHRRAAGLPALSVNWGAFSEVGLVAAQENRLARAARSGMRSLTPDEGTAILGRLLRSDAVQIGAAPFDVRQWAEFYPQAASSPRFSEIVGSAGGSRGPGDAGGAFREALDAAAPADRGALLSGFVLAQVAEVLRIDRTRVGRETPFKNLGIDSLMGLELRNRLESGLGLALPATLIWTYPHVEALAGHLAAKVGAAPGSAAAAQDAARAVDEEAQRARQERLAGLSDAELAALARDQLSDDDEDA